MAEPGLVISQLLARPSPRAVRLLEGAAVWSLRRVPEPAWLWGRPRRRSFHWGLGPVSGDFRRAFLAQGLDRYLAESRPELFSFDLGPAARSHQGILPLSRPLRPAEIFRRSRAGLDFVRRYYEGPLAAENYNFYPTGLYGPVADPEFIGRYLEEFDLGLVLDLAHAAVSAHNLGLEPEAYFRALPLERTRELHLSRPHLPSEPGLWAVDAHQAPSAREWRWLENVLKSGRLPEAVPVFVEYYRDLGKLIPAQEHLAGLLAGRGTLFR